MTVRFLTLKATLLQSEIILKFHKYLGDLSQIPHFLDIFWWPEGVKDSDSFCPTHCQLPGPNPNMQKTPVYTQVQVHISSTSKLLLSVPVSFLLLEAGRPTKLEAALLLYQFTLPPQEQVFADEVTPEDSQSDRSLEELQTLGTKAVS